MNPLDIIEARNAMVGMASLAFSYFTSLVEEGFTPEQALELTARWQAALCTPKESA